MTIRQALIKYHCIEIELLLADLLGKSKEFLFMNPGHSLSAGQLISLSALVKRRESGEPMAYILGYKDFYGLKFKVNRNVLIPRPETEWVVERIRNYELEIMNGKPFRVLDVGTGSGCIVISLAKLLPPSPNPSRQGRGKLQFCASDMSSEALKIAKQNAKKYKVKIKFIKSDLLKNIKGNFDVIIANLPYGWRGVKNRFSSVKDGLKFEPKKALYTSERGLREIRRLLQQVALLKNKPKLVYLEFDPRQKRELGSLIKKSLPGSKTKFYKDYNGFWRYAEVIPL